MTAGTWLAGFADELEAIGRSLPADVKWSLERARNGIEFEIPSPTPQHRTLSISACRVEITYSLGNLWSEQIDASSDQSRTYILAAVDAVVAGRVREVRDRKWGLLYHVYRLKTRGLDGYFRDAEYHPLHWFRVRPERVSIRRLPRLIGSVV